MSGIHKLVDGTLYRMKDGIVATCTCGWTSGPRFTSLTASALFLGHQEEAERNAKPMLISGKIGHLPAKSTCTQCPFRKDSERGKLGGYTPTMYVDVIIGVADLACHMSKGFDVRNIEAQRSCTGLANFRCNIGLIDRLPRGNSLDSALHAGPNTKDVFDSLTEFYRHHSVK